MAFLDARLSEARALNDYYTSHSQLSIHSGSEFGTRYQDSEIEAFTTKLRAPQALDALESAVKWARAEEAASEEFVSWASREDYKFGKWTPEGYHRLHSSGLVQDKKFKFDYVKPPTEAEIIEHLKRGPGSGPTVFHAQKLLAKTVEIRRVLEEAYETAASMRMIAKAGAVASNSGSRQGGIAPAERKMGRDIAGSSKTNKPRR